jgi:succinyl-diaminopimelate desuccinylase
MIQHSLLADILELAQTLVQIPSVTVGEAPRMEEVWRALRLAERYLTDAGLEVEFFDEGLYPALLAGFPQAVNAPVMLSGHLDVVTPEPDDSQFDPRLEGDYLVGRGAADMKTVVATFLVWMKESRRQGEPYPPINLMLIGNEETGESVPMGTGHVLQKLVSRNPSSYQPELLIAGERTEETGTRAWGSVCTQNRGVVRFRISGRGRRGHSSSPGPDHDLSARILRVSQKIWAWYEDQFTTAAEDGWRSQLRFPFFQVGESGVYNITPEAGTLGVELRPIPQDDPRGFIQQVEALCKAEGLLLDDLVLDPGVMVDAENPSLNGLLDAIERTSGSEPQIGRKMAGTSARFAPGGQGIVWGQSGSGAHSVDERHFIPSILPYYQALSAFGQNLLSIKAAEGSQAEA